MAAIQQLYWGRCPDCSSRLRVRRGDNGRFLGCSAFPRCQFTRDLDRAERNILADTDPYIVEDDGEDDGGTR